MDEEVANPTQDQVQEAPGKPSWEQLMQDPEYSRQMEEAVQERLKAERSAGARLEALTPALELLSRHFRVEPGDDAALSQAVSLGLDPEVRIQAHLQDLERQGEALRQCFPGFDLGQELQNPAFARLTAPGTGISVEDAYYALHRGDIQTAAMEAAARNTAVKLSRSIQSGALRPTESGSSSPAPAPFDYRAATPEQRSALKERIRQAGAKGEKIYP